MIDKLVSKLLDLLFPPPNPAYREALDEDLAYFEGLAKPDDKRPDPGAIGATQAIAMNEKLRRDDGTVYGHKPYPGAELGRELDRRAAMVPPCSPYPDAGEHCGHSCGGPAPEQWVINGPSGGKA